MRSGSHAFRLACWRLPRLDVGNMLAIGVVGLVGREVPVDAERQIVRRQVADKPQLDEVAHVARIAVLHLAEPRPAGSCEHVDQPLGDLLHLLSREIATLWRRR